MFNDLTLIEERKFESTVQSTRVLSIVIVTDNNVVRRIHQVCSEKFVPRKIVVLPSFTFLNLHNDLLYAITELGTILPFSMNEVIFHDDINLCMWER